MNYSDFYKQWAKQSGISPGQNDAISFLKKYAVPNLADQYASDMDYWRQGTQGRRDRAMGYYGGLDQAGTKDYAGMRQGLTGQYQYLQSLQPQFQQNIGDRVQAGRNMVRQSNMGQRMASANAYGRGVMNQATEQGNQQAAQFRRMGLGDAAQAGAMAQARTAGTMAQNQARLGATTPGASMDAARQQSMGYGQIGDAYGSAGQLGGQMAGLLQAIQGMDTNQLQQILQRMQGTMALDQSQDPSNSPLMQLAQLFSGWQQVKNSKPKSGMDFGGLFGGLASGLGANPGLFKK